jgi:hypothetical protein
MHAIPLALTRDYLRRSLWPGVFTLAYLAGMPWLGYQLIRWKGFQPPPEALQVPLPMGVLVVLLLGALSIAWVAQGENRFGVCSRLYVLPIPTWLMVACRMIQCGLTASALYLLVVALNNHVFGTTWPTLGPSLLLAVAAIWIQACTWSLHHFRLWRLLGLATILVSFGYWIGWRFYPEGFYSPRQNWMGPNVGEAIELIAYALVAFAVGWEGVARHRHGDNEGLPAWLARIERFWDTQVLHRERPFASPEEALVWQEWTRRGLAMPLAIGSLLLIVPLIGAINVAFGWARPIGVLEVQLVMAIAGLPQLAFVIGMYLGHRGLNSSQFQLDSYSATRPVTDAVLSAAFLRTAFRCVASSYAVGSAICLATLGWVCWQEGLVALDPIIRKIPLLDSSLGGWAIPLVCGAAILATWTSLGLGSSLVLAGEMPLMGWGFGGLIGALLGWMILVNLLLPPPVADVVGAIGAAVFGLGLIGGTAWSFQQAARRRLIAAHTPWLSLIAWLALCGLTATVLSIGQTTHNPTPQVLRWLWLPLLPGMLALVFTPLALAPLALAWNRHR